jgi:hypothetical protein
MGTRLAKGRKHTTLQFLPVGRRPLAAVTMLLLILLFE